MKIPARLAALLLPAALLAAGAAHAQSGGFDTPGPGPGLDQKHEDEENAPPDRKRPSLFNRPARRSPAAQLAHAERLLATGHRRAAARQFNALVRRWGDADEAPRAQLALARIQEQRRRYERAFDEYHYLTTFYVGACPFREALEHEFQLANAVATQRHMKFLFLPGFEAPEVAIPLFQRLLDSAPAWERAPEIRYRIATLHEAAGELSDAARSYAHFLESDADSPLAGDAAFRRAAVLRDLTRDTPSSESALQDALDAADMYLENYSSHASVAQGRALREEVAGRLAALAYGRAEFYDRKARKPRAALLAYEAFVRRFPQAAQAGAAAARAERLRKELGEHEG